MEKELQKILLRCFWRKALSLGSTRSGIRRTTPENPIANRSLQEMDLGKGAYVVNDPTYENEWSTAISSVLGEHYEKVASHQLIGICLVVFANKALVPAISGVRKSHLPTGHFSLLGNKGATAIRFKCYDSTICFLNVHLYHVADAATRRTGDLRRILRELVFDGADKIRAHDHVFLFGDLNYRVCLKLFIAN